MDLQIIGQNVEILPTVRSYVEKKLDKLNRHLPNMNGIKVELTEQKTKSPGQRYRAQVTLDTNNGTLLRAEERAENLLVAIDKVVPALDRQIERYKGKLYKKNKTGQTIRGVAPEETAGETTEAPRVVRTKRFPVKLMSAEEAIDQMELLGHDFFLFHNAETKELNLLYRRNDGNYSIIEPEME
jgi:putative sigma-54 modulation protein